MSFHEVEELNSDPRNGMVGIDLIAVVRARGEMVFCGADSLIVALENAYSQDL